MKINVGQFLEAMTAAQAGRKAGQVAGMQAAQELARQKQMMDLQLEDQRMQRESFAMQQQQFAAGEAERKRQRELADLQGQMGMLPADSPYLAPLQARVFEMFGGKMPEGQMPGAPLPPVPPALYKGTTPEAQGMTPPVAAPSTSPFRKPPDPRRAGVAEQAKRHAATYAEFPKAVEAYSGIELDAQNEQVPTEALLQRIQQANQLVSQLAASHRNYAAAQGKIEDLKKRRDNLGIRPDLLPRAEAIINAKVNPDDPESVAAFDKIYSGLLAESPFQPGKKEKTDDAELRWREESARDAASKRIAESLNYAADDVRTAIGAGNVAEARRRMRMYDEIATKNGRSAYGAGTDLDPAPRMLSFSVPYDPKKDRPKGEAIGPMGAAKEMVGGKLTSTITREETPAEINARVSSALADEIAKTPAEEKRRREAAKDAFGNIEKVLKTVKALDPASRDKYFDQLVKYGGAAGMQMAQIVRGLKPEDMTPYQEAQVARMKARDREQIRQFGLTHQRLKEQTDKALRAGALTQQQMRIAMQLEKQVGGLEAKKRQLEAYQRREDMPVDTGDIDAEIRSVMQQWAIAVGANYQETTAEVLDPAGKPTGRKQVTGYSVGVPPVAVKEKPKVTFESALAVVRKRNASQPVGKRLTEEQLKSQVRQQMKAMGFM